jgi:signal transduction histidine kinase
MTEVLSLVTLHSPLFIMSLRTRLLLSYTLVIVTCLAVIGLALLLLLRDDPVQKRLLTGRLTTEAGVIARLVRNQFLNGATADQILRRLETVTSGNSDTRILVINSDSGAVLADTDSSLTGKNLFVLGKPTRSGSVLNGEFDADNQHWLYSSRQFLLAPIERKEIIAAAPFDKTPISQDPVFSELLRPLLIAGLLALGISIVLAIIITRSVMRPMQHVAQAADRIASGDYSQRVPVEGSSEVQEMATNFNAMTQKVRDTQQSQRDFLANVTHELKTPLTSIQGFSQAIKDGLTNEPESIRKSAAIIFDEANRMGRMVSELLDLARIESGQIVMRSEPVKIDQLLLSVVEKMALRAQQGSIALDSQIPIDLPALNGDGDRLAQVFSNLIDNALKHTPAGGKVTVSARSLSGSSIVRRGKLWPGGVEVIVADTGSGIPPEDLPRIFDRFYQVDKSRARSVADGSNLGLGLAIVKHIVVGHGGSINAESIVGLGTKFVVILPIERGTKQTH